jgi:SAM-dependent methyltransferase
VKKLKYLFPRPARAWVKRRIRVAKVSLAADHVRDWSVLRRVQPYRSDFGIGRGQCIDRYYIERFLASHRDAIHGQVAEVGDAQYTAQFGADRVAQSHVLDLNDQNDQRTLTIDLTRTEQVPEGLFDCIIATQVLLFIRDYSSAIRSLYKMLKNGGVLLVTLPGISPLVVGPMVDGVGEDLWRFTDRSASCEFGAVFGESHIEVCTYGNVLSATAFLHGLVSEELTTRELEHHDPSYQVLIGVRATKQPVP